MITNDNGIKKYWGMYQALVENNGFPESNDDTTVYKTDAENRNRIQVRVEGIHTSSKEDSILDGIPIQHLPWAEQAGSLFGGFGPNKSGQILVPERGSYVWVFFIDGNPQFPVYFASVIGKDDVSDDAKKDVITYKTPGGHKIELSDETDAGFIKITTTAGTVINIDDKKDDEKIQITDKNDNDILLDKNGISVTDKNDNEVTGSSSGIIIKDKNGNEIQLTATGITLVTGDASTWLPNILPNCLFTGAPHGGALGGIVKLKGG